MMRLFITSLMLFIIGLAGIAEAADVPASVEPGRIEKRFEQPIQPKSKLEPIIPEMEKQMPPEESDQIKFILTSIVIAGSTVYSDTDLLPLYEGYLGKEISLTTIYKIAESITAKYGNDGYSLSRAVVPAQKIKNGVVHITIIEGFVDKVIIEGKLQDKRKFFSYYETQILASTPLDSALLERYLLLANDLAGMTVKAIFKPSEDTQGASTLVITVEEDRFDGNFSLDNRGSRSVGPVQATLSNNVNSSTMQFSRTGLTVVQTTSWNELHYAALYHEEVMNPEGLKLNLTVTGSKSEPGTSALEALELESESRSFTTQISYPYIRSRRENLTLKATFNYKNSKSYQLGQKTSRDKLRVLRIGADYDFADQYRGINQLSVELSKGLDIFGATENDDPLKTRVDGKSDFSKLTFNASRSQELAEGLSVYAALMGQKAFNALLSSEECGVGGEAFGRAYDSSEITGDSCVAGSIELRYLASVAQANIDYAQLYGFYDIGKIYKRHTFNNEKSRESIASAGLGVRFGLNDHFSGSLELAKPLTRKVAETGDDDLRLFARITASF